MIKRILNVVTLAILVMASTVSFAVAQEAAGGITDGQELGAIGLAVLVARFFAKLIPDSEGGIFGIVRQILKFVGAYTPNNR